MTSRSNHHLGIVAPVYNEEEGLGRFISRVVAAAESAGFSSYEFLLVDDGSTDQSVEIIKACCAQNASLSLLRLSRNFGHQAAVTAGLAHVGGEVVLVIDADLQDPPELLSEMVERWEEGCEVIFAQRTGRQESGLRRVGFELFHRFFRYFIEFPIPLNIGVFCLLDRKALDEINRLGERNRFLPGLHSWVGFRQSFVSYERAERERGQPSQTFRSLSKYAVDGVLSFSYKPIRLIGLFGTVVSIGSFGLASCFALKRLFGVETAFTGFTTLVLLITLFGGLTLMALAVIGEFIARIYDEVRSRPLYIIREHHKSPR